MSRTKTTSMVFVPSVEEVPRISDSERTELLASLEAGRAEIAAGNFDVVTSGSLRKEFAAILAKPSISDEELDASLGIVPQIPR